MCVPSETNSRKPGKEHDGGERATRSITRVGTSALFVGFTASLRTLSGQIAGGSAAEPAAGQRDAGRRPRQGEPGQPVGTEDGEHEEADPAGHADGDRRAQACQPLARGVREIGAHEADLQSRAAHPDHQDEGRAERDSQPFDIGIVPGSDELPDGPEEGGGEGGADQRDADQVGTSRSHRYGALDSRGGSRPIHCSAAKSTTQDGAGEQRVRVEAEGAQDVSGEDDAALAPPTT